MSKPLVLPQTLALTGLDLGIKCGTWEGQLAEE